MEEELPTICKIIMYIPKAAYTHSVCGFKHEGNSTTEGIIWMTCGWQGEEGQAGLRPPQPKDLPTILNKDIQWQNQWVMNDPFQ